MDIVTLADAEQRLGELVDHALDGEPLRISRGDKLVELVALSEPAVEPRPTPRFDFEALKRLRDSMPMSQIDSVELIRMIRMMRAEERY